MLSRAHTDLSSYNVNVQRQPRFMEERDPRTVALGRSGSGAGSGKYKLLSNTGLTKQPLTFAEAMWGGSRNIGFSVQRQF